MKFSEIKGALKHSLKSSPKECVALIEQYAFQLSTHPSFTINLCHKVWAKAFSEPSWISAVQKMGELGFKPSNTSMWLKKSIENQKNDLACLTHQFANYNNTLDKSCSALQVASYIKSDFLVRALTANPLELSYKFERIPWSKMGDTHISKHRIEGHTLAYNLLLEAPLTLASEIIRHNNYTPTAQEWGALVSSYRINKHPVLSFNELSTLLLLDNNNGEFALQSMIAENNHRWSVKGSSEEALQQISTSNSHLKHLAEVVEHLRSQKVKNLIEENLNNLDAVSKVKRKI